MRSLVFLIISIMLSACSGLMLGGGSSGASAQEKDRATTSNQVSDAALSERVRAKYAADPVLAPAAITVRSAAGMVTLAGTVSTYAARESAEKLAMATSGVKAVDNRITVNYEK